MAIKVWELAAADPKRVFSPYCWASRLALFHKGLEFESVPWRFVEKEKLQAVSGQGLVPVIEDGGKVVNDSWDIAVYLESKYADCPSLFGGNSGGATARFVQSWTLNTMMRSGVPQLFMPEIYPHLSDDDKPTFRKAREERFGKKLEEMAPESERPAKIAAFREALEPLRSTLGKQPFIGGSSPLYHDIILFSFLMFAKCVSPIKLLDADDPVFAWRARMLEHYAGALEGTVSYPV